MPWLVRQPAKRQIGAGELAMLQLDHRGNRHQRKSVARTLAHLAIELLAHDRGRQRYRSDDFPLLEDIIAPRRVAGQAMEFAHWHATLTSVTRYDRHLRIERAHRDRHVTGIGCNTLVARSEYGVQLGHAVDRAAAAARLALVAGLVDIHEVEATRTLAQIAAGRGLVAQLLRRAGKDGTGEQRIIAAHPRMHRRLGVGRQGANPQTAIGRILDLAEADAVDIGQLARSFDL